MMTFSSKLTVSKMKRIARQLLVKDQVQHIYSTPHAFEPAGSYRNIGISFTFFESKPALLSLHGSLSSLPKTAGLPHPMTASRCFSRTRRTLSQGIPFKISS